jgi:energy-converting hydrogenase Eha subunit A
MVVGVFIALVISACVTGPVVPLPDDPVPPDDEQPARTSDTAAITAPNVIAVLGAVRFISILPEFPPFS